ncbi:hypothetical protein MHBO_003868, partial [Bonamia ostreae]
VKSIFLLTIEKFFKKVKNLTLTNWKCPKSSEKEKFSPIFSFYSKKIQMSKNKFTFLLARQFYVMYAANNFFRGNKKIHFRIKENFLQKYINPLKKLSFFDAIENDIVTRETFRFLSFKNWENRKILESLIDVHFILKSLLFEGIISLRIQGMSIFSEYIKIYPKILQNGQIFSVLRERCRDQSAVIREMAVSIVGNVFLDNNDSELLDLLQSRILDSSVVVRKSVIGTFIEYLNKNEINDNFKMIFCALLDR